VGQRGARHRRSLRHGDRDAALTIGPSDGYVQRLEDLEDIIVRVAVSVVRPDADQGDLGTHGLQERRLHHAAERAELVHSRLSMWHVTRVPIDGDGGGGSGSPTRQRRR
jgi:hypothetical protein